MMFCNQCEQTAQGVGCTIKGVCGKTSDVAVLQDLLIYALKGISILALEAQRYKIIDKNLDQFAVKTAFSTLTNVNFDPQRITALIKQAIALRESLKIKIQTVGGTIDSDIDAIHFSLARTYDGIIEQGKHVGLRADVSKDPDIQSLHQIILYCIKGIAAYAYHAQIFGQKDSEVFRFMYKALSSTLNPNMSAEQLLDVVLECGKFNLLAMKLLDDAHTGTYGHPVPVQVPLGVKKGKAILVSGHDLKDLDEILKQSEGKGILVYTHGEMLPSHGYPELKKYAHFYGHFGTAWQNQRKEFARFPGAIVMTTNCIQQPHESYKDKIFTTGVVGWPGVKHISDYDFTPVIKRGLALPGFSEDVQGKSVTTGFGHHAVVGIADKIVKAVNNKHIRHFFLVAGCDGAKAGRNYYTEFVEKVPKDCVVLTLACGKYRFFNKDLGDIQGIPRIIDIGQCNDAYSAIQIALALAKAFNVDVNELPLSLVLSWYEQKAVAILLTLLHLNIKNIRLGPSLPAFITPNILQVLIDKFNIMPITTPNEDLKAILGENRSLSQSSHNHLPKTRRK